MRVGVEVPARAANGDSPLSHGLEVTAACDQVDVRTASAECRANVRADGPGTDDRDLH
jgi:hypothetical protein